MKNTTKLANLYEFKNMRDGEASTIRIALVNPEGKEELYTHWCHLEDAEKWAGYYLNRRVYKGYSASARIVE